MDSEGKDPRALWEPGALCWVLALAALGSLAAWGQLWRLAGSGFVPKQHAATEAGQALFLMTQATLLAVLMLCCALAGELFGKRCGAAGRINTEWIRAHWWKLALAGLAIGALSLALYDVHLARHVPDYYPRSALALMLEVSKNIFVDELVFRHGVLALAMAATRRFQLANSLAAAVTGLAAARSFSLLGGAPESYLPWSVTLAFAFALLQGWVYRKGGLAACMIVRGSVSLKATWFALGG